MYLMSKKWPAISALGCGLDKDTVENINQQDQRSITKKKENDGERPTKPEMSGRQQKM